MSGNGTNGTNGNGLVPASNGNGRGWAKGQSGNPHGREPKKLDRDYFAVAKRAVTKQKWRLVVLGALGTALDPDAHPLAVAKARDFLLKALSLESRVRLEVAQVEDPEAVRIASLAPRDLLDEYRKTIDALAGPAKQPGS